MTHKIKTLVAYIEPWYKRQRKQFHLTHKEKYEEKFLARFHLTRKCHAKQAALTGTGATFDWTFFDNSNRRKVDRRPSKVVIFDSDLVRRGSSNCRRLN